MTVFLCLIQGFLSLFAFIRLMQLSTSNPLTLILFTAISFIYYQFTKNQFECRIKLKDQWFSAILSLVFSGITILDKYPTVILNTNSKPEAIVMAILTVLGLFIIYYHILLWLFVACGELTINRNIYPSRSLPVITFIGSIVVFGFYYINSFPGIIPEKTALQFQEINGTKMFSDDISLVHTTLLDKLYKLAHLLTGDSTTSVAVLTALQLLLLSFVAAYCVKTLQKAHIHSLICVLAVLYYLVPYHGLMATTLSVDTLFAVNLAGFTAVVTRLFLKSDQKAYSKLKWFSIIAPYFIFGFILCTLSLNGLVIFIISFPFILITLKEKWQAPLFTSLAIFAFVAFINFPFMHLYEIERKHFIDCLSPTIRMMFDSNSDISFVALLKDFALSNLPLIYPQEITLSAASTLEPVNILSIPSFILDTLLTMQTCIPLYGILFSPGAAFWATLISLFLCSKNERQENISLILPSLLFVIMLIVFPPAKLVFSEMYPLFLVLPMILLIPFMDSECEY